MHNFKTLYRRSLGGHACLQLRCYATRKTHYQVLGVKKTATQQEIKDAYIQLSKKHHPDTAGAGSKQTFTEINEAYSVLSKPLTRKEYDNKLIYNAAQQTASSSNYRPPGSGPAGYTNNQYQQRKHERTYQSEEGSTYSDFHRRREAFNRMKMAQKRYEEQTRMYREFEQRMYRSRSKVQDRLMIFLEFYVVTAFMGLIFLTYYALAGLKSRRHKAFHLARKWSAEIFHGVVITCYLIVILLYGRMHERMYTQSELYRKYYEFYGREEAERREAVKEKNGVTANLIVLGGLLLAFMISVTRISVKMMLQSVNRNRYQSNNPNRDDVSSSTSISYVVLGLLFLLTLSTGFVFHKASWHLNYIKKLNQNANPELQRSPSDELKRKMDRETRERRQAIEIEKDITPPKA